MRRNSILLLTAAVLASGAAWAIASWRDRAGPATESRPVQAGVRERYQKLEYFIPMRDGVKLYTAVYVPKNKPGRHPMLIERTPYSAGPYGPDEYVPGFGGSAKFQEAGYIFVYQDVRGRFMSEGAFEEIRPQLAFRLKPHDVDESTDAYDTVAYLVRNVPGNNGRVGFWGVSYPGYYAATAGIRAHPAVKAISPQAPVAEWFLGDDVHHNGAFFLHDNFDFYFWFGYDKPGPAEEHPQIEPMPDRPDAYRFFLEMGSAIEADRKYFKGRYPFWLDICNHPNMDDFWQARSLPAQMKEVRPAVLTVGGWFDAEDLYGALAMYRHVEKQNPGAANWLVMGPWAHGQWGDSPANRLGPVRFGSADLGRRYRDEIEFPFFDAYLRGDGKWSRPKAEMFETGTNVWRSFPAWPPKTVRPGSLYLHSNGRLAPAKPAPGETQFDRYISDPSRPVPYAPGTIRERPSSYMVADQRFLSGRDDVLGYRTEPLAQPLTMAGPIDADLYVATTGADADFVVKVIDVHPADGPLPNAQILVRAEVIRGRFRNSFQNPKPFVPGRVERVPLRLNDVLHTFGKGHRVMVQIQSSWFPLVDRNPQTWVNPYTAKPEDYRSATVQVFRSAQWPSGIRFGRL